jgi:hypothetical protein
MTGPGFNELTLIFNKLTWTCRWQNFRIGNSRATTFRHVPVQLVVCAARMFYRIDKYECHIMAFCWELTLFSSLLRRHCLVWFISWLWCCLYRHRDVKIHFYIFLSQSRQRTVERKIIFWKLEWILIKQCEIMIMSYMLMKTSSPKRTI